MRRLERVYVRTGRNLDRSRILSLSLPLSIQARDETAPGLETGEPGDQKTLG